MSFKENMQAKIKLDRLFRQLISTMKEPPGRWWLDKVLARELLDMTDFEPRKLGIFISTYVPWRARPWKSWFSTMNCPSTTRPWPM